MIILKLNLLWLGEGICKWERWLEQGQGVWVLGLGRCIHRPGESHTVHLSCLRMYIVTVLDEGADSVGEVFAFDNGFQLMWIEEICFQAHYTCAARDSMFHWSGRSVTGTRVVIVFCFSLFALVSMPYKVATCLLLNLNSDFFFYFQKVSFWVGSGGGKFLFLGAFLHHQKEPLLLGGAFLMWSFYLLPLTRSLQIFILRNLLSFLP